MKKIPLHTQILTGMIVGFLWGFIAIYFGAQNFTLLYIKPFGDIFINLLTLIAIPLVVASLISGVAGLNDMSKLSRIGTKTIAIYISVTALAVSIGLVTVNIIQPERFFSEESRQEMQMEHNKSIEDRLKSIEEQEEAKPLDIIVNIVPSNLFSALSHNANMLQIVFFALFFGITLVMIPDEKSLPVFNFFDGISHVIIKMVEVIMKAAPFGVFALIAAMMADFAGDDPQKALHFLGALAMYGLTVICGLAVMVFIVYPLMLKLFTKQNIPDFFRGILPAQLLAFSTSSSVATLPVTMKRVEEKLGVSKEVSSFVLPLGATINMDGTSIYQAIAAVFIAHAFGMEMTITNQLTIVLTATLASIGTAGVPGAGIIMLAIVLNAVGVDPGGIALVLAVDRPLDMCRTMVNVTGDATVASIIHNSENKKLMA